MPTRTTQSTPTPVRATRGKTVGQALIRSYLHDVQNRDNPDYKPLYTQTQFNRMVAGLRSEVEHRVYAQYMALYNGIVEEFARAHGYYQQAQNASGRLLAHLSDAVRAEEAERLLALVPGYVPEAPRGVTLASLALRALAFYQAHPEGASPAMAEALRAYHSSAEPPVDGQLSFLSGTEGAQDESTRYLALLASHPALAQALLEDLDANGIYMPDPLNTPPDALVASVQGLARNRLYGYETMSTPGPDEGQTPLQALRALFVGMEQLRFDPLDVDELREVLYIPALRWLRAYNLLIAHLAASFGLPTLTCVMMEEDIQQAHLARYNEGTATLQQNAQGPDAPQKAARAAHLFPPIAWPAVQDEAAAAAVYDQAKTIATYEDTTIQRLVLALMEAIA